MPCHAMPCRSGKRHCGAHGPQSESPTSERDPPASGLLPGVFLRGGARVPARPERAGPHSGAVGLSSWATSGAGVVPAEKSAPAAGAGGGGAHTEEPARSPVPEGRPDVPHLPVPAESSGTAPCSAPSPRWPGPLRPADPFLCKRTTDRDKWLQLETGLIDTISSVIASKIR